MCCLFAVILFLGPRIGALVWWLFSPLRFEVIFSSILWPILGIIFAPWTTLMYVLVGVDGVNGFEWLFIIIAILADLSSYGGSAYGNREMVTGKKKTSQVLFYGNNKKSEKSSSNYKFDGKGFNKFSGNNFAPKFKGF